MIFDCIKQFEIDPNKTIVVVAPRILLASQLCSEFLEYIDDAHVMHVHSGETSHFSSTNPKKISAWVNILSGKKLIFTTYHSLHKIKDSGVNINTIYFDEAHNSVKKSFFESTEYFSINSQRCYYFTATPKHSHTYKKPGMNDANVYGKVIINVSAPELINNGSILPPKLVVKSIKNIRDKEFGAERDCMTLLDILVNEDNMDKVLICSPNTKVLIRMLAETEFMSEVRSYGYDVFWITAKHGAFLNNKKISREKFFELIAEYGKDDSKKFIVLHYSILSEGISVPGLTSCVMMRQMNIIEMTQSIGRVLRLHMDDIKSIKEGKITPGNLESYKKPFGFIHLPVYENVGIATVRRLESVIETVFEEGQPAISVIKK
jgi:superfamily II DNA or RNA helicase